MIRRVSLCQHLLKHIANAEVNKLHQLNSALYLTQQRRWCHQKGDTHIKPVRFLDPVSAEKNDTFLAEIRGFKNLEEMVAHIDMNKDHIGSLHLHEVFQKINKLVKEDPSVVDLLKSEIAFAKLCQHTLKHIRQFNRDETVNIIRVLCALKVPLDSTLGQAAFQMLRHFINDLTLYQITDLDRLLKDQPHNALVDAVKKALPLVLEIHLLYQLDHGDLWLILNCLAMAIRHNLQRSTIEKLVTILYHKTEVLSPKKAVKACTCLSGLKPFPPNLRSPAWEILSRTCYFAMELSQEETDNLLLALDGARHLYHPKLFSVLSHRCCHEAWDLERTSRLLSIFNTHKFLSTSLLDWTLKLLETDSSPLWENEKIPLVTVFEAFSEANHSIDAKHFHSLVDRCEEKLVKLEEDSPELLVKLAMHLAILECLPPDLMEKVFQPEFISKSMRSAAEKKLDSSLLQCYLALEQSARVECEGSYQGPFLPPDILKEAIVTRGQVMKPIDLILKQFLEVGLGGSQFMLTGLWTKLGHFIDHLVVMRKEDFPVQLNNDAEPLVPVKDCDGFCFVEDVALPDNAKILAVLVARQEWFNRDPPSLRGWMSFQQRTLTKMGYNPVIIGPPTANADHIQDIDCRLENESY